MKEKEYRSNGNVRRRRQRKQKGRLDKGKERALQRMQEKKRKEEGRVYIERKKIMRRNGGKKTQ